MRPAHQAPCPRTYGMQALSAGRCFRTPAAYVRRAPIQRAVVIVLACLLLSTAAAGGAAGQGGKQQHSSTLEQHVAQHLRLSTIDLGALVQQGGWQAEQGDASSSQQSGQQQTQQQQQQQPHQQQLLQEQKHHPDAQEQQQQQQQEQQQQQQQQYQQQQEQEQEHPDAQQQLDTDGSSRRQLRYTRHGTRPKHISLVADGDGSTGAAAASWQSLSATHRHAAPKLGGQPRGYLAICVVVRDQGADLLEWIEWHRCLGASHFYVYDHNSTQPLLSDIWHYVQQGVVTYTYFKGWGMDPRVHGFSSSVQYYAYDDCTQRARHNHRWLAFIDADEFIVPFTSPKASPFSPTAPNERVNVSSVLQLYEGYGGLGINWRLFGTGGHKVLPADTTPEAYLHCTAADHPMNRHVKIIGNTDFMGTISPACPHEVTYQRPKDFFTVDENFNKVVGVKTAQATFKRIALYHYVTKSVEQFEGKVSRGSPDGYGKPPGWWKIVDAMCTSEDYEAAKIARICKLGQRVAEARRGALTQQP